MTNSFSDPAIILPQAVDTMELKDGAVTNGKVNAAAAIAKSKLANLDIVNADVNAAAAILDTKISPVPSTELTNHAALVPAAGTSGHLRWNVIQYTGNGTLNRALAHGIGRVPILAITSKRTASEGAIQTSDTLWQDMVSGNGEVTVTARDATNVYLGGTFGNINGSTYQMVVMG